jgi:hypothetical protein
MEQRKEDNQSQYSTTETNGTAVRRGIPKKIRMGNRRQDGEEV